MAVFKNNTKDKVGNYSPDKLNSIQDGTEIKGDLSVISSVRIDGIIVGNVTCSSKLVLGSTGRIIGNIISAQAEIEGEVEGEVIIQDRLVLKNGCQILGNIKTEVIVIEEGAKFDGLCKMSSATQPPSHLQTSEIDNKEEDVVY